MGVGGLVDGGVGGAGVGFDVVVVLDEGRVLVVLVVVVDEGGLPLPGGL